jgi:hypothetical protein
MQAVAAAKGKSAIDAGPRQDEPIRYFLLDGALPEGHALVMNTQLGTLSYLASGGAMPQLLAQQQFTASELSLLLPLLEQFPHYCPYEVMLASFYNGTITEATIDRCRRHLQDALEDGVWDQQMRPVRNVLSRVRFKLRNIPGRLDIVSILETGYVLLVGAKASSARTSASS